MIRPFRPLALAGLAALGMLAAPAADATPHKRITVACPDDIMPGQPLGRFVFHMKSFEVGDDDGIGDKTFEFRFKPEVRLHAKTVGSTIDRPGPVVCRLDDADVLDWRLDLPVLNILKGGKRVYPISLEFVLENVPRDTFLSFRLRVIEEDDIRDDWADFNPYGGLSSLLVAVDVQKGTARSWEGVAGGFDDVQLNRQKRVVGDGTGSAFPAGAAFVVNIHPYPQPKTGQIGQVAAPPPAKIAALAKGREDRCRQYALSAVEMTLAAQKLPCPAFGPPAWSTNHQAHFDWCMQGLNVVQAATEELKRALALAACAADRGQAAPVDACALYAELAVEARASAVANGCPVPGPRWSADQAAHAAWCRGGPDAGVLLAEQQGRAGALRACLAN